MRHSSRAGQLSLAAAFAVLSTWPAAAQTLPPESPFALPAVMRAVEQNAAAAAGAPVRRLSADEAVALAIAQNLGIQVERLNPQIQDLAVAQTRATWVPMFTTNIGNTSTDSPITNLFAGGQNKVTDRRLDTAFGVQQQLPTGGNYTLSWDSTRSTSTNFFNNFNPQLRSNVSFNITQPLLRNRVIDSTRQQLQINERIREITDVNLRATITQTTRNVRNAYWDLVFAINNLTAQRQSLDLARRLLADNEKRVQIGTMAPIDIVEAQSEVARNQEAVIVAEAAIKQAEDRLRTLILDPDAVDFWTTTIEPTDSGAFSETATDVSAAVQRAMANRSEVQQAKNNLQQNDVTIQFLRNQVLPDINASASYGLVGLGGSLLEPLSFSELGGSVPTRNILSTRGFGSVLGDVFTNAYPAWTFGIQIGYPLGTSATEANLARARLQHTQAETQLRNLQLQVATEVRDAARQVQTNRQRVDTSRVARELAERRLDAEEKKFAAGIQTSFFVFQAQRDLAQARTNEVKAILDYNKSLVDYEAVQEVPLR
ncbi:MAG: TolC family protein [Vicinamibacterales bacterium]